MSETRLAIVFKDFAAWLNTSCVGLNVAGYATAKVLNASGIKTTVFPVRHNVDLVDAIEKYNREHKHPLTHVVISAPWLSLYDLEQILKHFRTIKFAVLSHSNVGFLQADFDGVKLLREYQKLSRRHRNFRVGGNSKKFSAWLTAATSHKALLLPNLYPLPHIRPNKPYWGGTIKVGAFGAVRPYKNFMTAAGAAIALQHFTGSKVEFHMSSGGEEGDTRAIEQLFQDIPGVRLIKHPWTLWHDFIQLIASMDVLMQPSFTESFNMITADGISVGVPSVVSTAINWAPASWVADSDNALSVCSVAIRLLVNSESRGEGYDALKKHNEASLDYWFDFVGEKRKEKRRSLLGRIKDWF
jgi:glycosyltransferase involved in cell wall biosynthesis